MRYFIKACQHKRHKEDDQSTDNTNKKMQGRRQSDKLKQSIPHHKDK